MNQLADFIQICMDITFGTNVELIRFGDRDLIFKVTAGLQLQNINQKMLVCLLSHELFAGMLPNLHVCIIWQDQ